MKKISFLAQRKLVSFVIEDRKVTYYDDSWKEGLQIYPLDRLMVKKMIVSRKSSISAMGLLIADANAGKNLEDYENCSNENELVEMIRKDCLSKGLVEVR